MATLGRLMPLDLPQFIDPLRFAKAGKQLSGHFAIPAMERLSALLFEDSGQVSFKLEFGHDIERKVFFISGQVQAELTVVCQRCLQGLELQINSSLKLGIVSTKNEAELLPPDYEPLMLVDNSISLLELIEDELLLALPMAALHDNEQCSASKALDEDFIIEENRPFAELEKLKKKTLD